MHTDRCLDANDTTHAPLPWSYNSPCTNICVHMNRLYKKNWGEIFVPSCIRSTPLSLVLVFKHTPFYNWRKNHSL